MTLPRILSTLAALLGMVVGCRPDPGAPVVLRDGGSTSCPAPLRMCGICVDVEHDPDNCGACGRSCGSLGLCDFGTCICPEGTTRCDAACVDVRSDPRHCGSCENDCGDVARCESYSCVCDSGLEYCESEGSCVDTSYDPFNCGACGRMCPSAPNSYPSCHLSACRLECFEGFADCDADYQTGCETISEYRAHDSILEGGYGWDSSVSPATGSLVGRFETLSGEREIAWATVRLYVSGTATTRSYSVVVYEDDANGRPGGLVASVPIVNQTIGTGCSESVSVAFPRGVVVVDSFYLGVEYTVGGPEPMWACSDWSAETPLQDAYARYGSGSWQPQSGTRFRAFGFDVSFDCP